MRCAPVFARINKRVTLTRNSSHIFRDNGEKSIPSARGVNESGRTARKKEEQNEKVRTRGYKTWILYHVYVVCAHNVYINVRVYGT